MRVPTGEGPAVLQAEEGESLIDVVLVGELLVQCQRALRHYRRLRSASRRWVRGPQNGRTADVLWDELQSFLSATAAASRVLWEGQCRKKLHRFDKCEDRAKRIRSALAIDDSSPLWSREARNTFEHHEELLQSWIEHHPDGGTITGPAIGRLEDFPVGRSWYHRVLDPFTLRFRHLDQPPTDLTDVAREVRTVVSRLKRRARTDRDWASVMEAVEWVPSHPREAASVAAIPPSP